MPVQDAATLPTIPLQAAAIEQTYGVELGANSVSVGRFITHLRFLFVRIYKHKQLHEEHRGIGEAIRNAYPEAVTCAQRLASLVELRLGSALTDDEIGDLTLHVARAASDPF